MKLLSFVAVLLALAECSDGAALSCKFVVQDETTYACVVTGHSYTADDESLKIFGKHISGYKNSHVTLFDASRKQNNFEIFPTAVLELFTNIKVVKLEAVQLKELNNASLTSCDNLNQIYFGDDSISLDAGVFENCKNLEVLQFEGNQIDSIDVEAFRGLSNLHTLKLNNNSISFIDPKTFESISSNLTNLKITNNQIKTVDATFSALKNLRLLDLTNNTLTSIPKTLVSGLKSLEYLGLSGNNISAIEKNILEVWPNHASWNLEDNKCVDKEFVRLGSDELPMADVIPDLQVCFDGYKEAQKSEATDDNATTTASVKGKNRTEKADKYASSDETMSVISLASTTTVESSTQTTNKIVTNAANQTSTKAISEDKSTTTVESSTKKPQIDDKKTTEKASSVAPAKENADDADVPSDSEHNSEETSTSPPPTTTAATTTTKAAKTRKAKKPKIEATTTSVILSTIASTTVESATTTSAAADSSTKKSKAIHQADVGNCRFFLNNDDKYICVLKGARTSLKSIGGKHEEGLSDDDVTELYITNSTLRYIPNAVFEQFKNLEVLSVKKVGIKYMDSDLLESCGKLKTLDIRGNRIRRVTADSLKACTDLESVDITNNPVETIERGIFDNNPKLKVVFGKLEIA